MLKNIVFLILVITAFSAQGTELKVLTPEELKSKITEINHAQNQVLMQGSTVADADKLFALYTDDFIYIQEVYGGIYARDELYNNTIPTHRRNHSLQNAGSKSETFQSRPIPSGNFYAGIIRHMRATSEGTLLIHQGSTNRIILVTIDD